MKKTSKIITAAVLTVAIGATTLLASGAANNLFNYSNNGQKSQPLTDSVVIDGHLYLPLRSMSKALDKYVYWDEFSRTAALTDKPQLTGKYSLKAPDLATGIKMGVGSSLTHIPGDPDNVFYSTADRGPNGQVTIDDKTVRTFPLAGYTPSIYKIQIADGEIKILQTIPLKVNGTDPVSGKATITGLPNIKGRDEAPYDATGKTELSYDPYGLDIEGLAYSVKDDSFWISDEYGPSIVHVKRDGTIMERIVPQGWAAQATTPLVPSRETMPTIYNKLRQNRGAEAVGVTSDGAYMFMAMQSALRNPDKSTDNSRQLRILKFDLKTLMPVAEYVYVAEDVAQFTGLVQGDIVISDLVVVNENTLLIDERDKNAGDKAQLKSLFMVNLSEATNTLGKYDSAVGGKTLEQMTVADIISNGIVPVSKRLVADFTEFKFPYEKIEGVTLINGDTIVIVNDNDFGIDSTSPTNGTELWTFKLPYKIQ